MCFGNEQQEAAATAVASAVIEAAAVEFARPRLANPRVFRSNHDTIVVHYGGRAHYLDGAGHCRAEQPEHLPVDVYAKGGSVAEFYEELLVLNADDINIPRPEEINPEELYAGPIDDVESDIYRDKNGQPVEVGDEIVVVSSCTGVVQAGGTVAGFGVFEDLEGEEFDAALIRLDVSAKAGNNFGVFNVPLTAVKLEHVRLV